jgi:hypothetical protein
MEIYAKGRWQFVEKIRDMFSLHLPVVSGDANDATGTAGSAIRQLREIEIDD